MPAQLSWATELRGRKSCSHSSCGAINPGVGARAKETGTGNRLSTQKLGSGSPGCWAVSPSRGGAGQEPDPHAGQAQGRAVCPETEAFSSASCSSEGLGREGRTPLLTQKSAPTAGVCVTAQSYFRSVQVLKIVRGSFPPLSPFLVMVETLFENILFIFREREREEQRERDTNVWLPLMRPLLGTWPTNRACALTGNRTSYTLVHRLSLNPLNHTSQGFFLNLETDGIQYC